jgi:hypothetical protein
VGCDDGLDDGETEADSASVSAARKVRTIKAVENMWKYFWRNSNALIGDLQTST